MSSVVPGWDTWIRNRKKKASVNTPPAYLTVPRNSFKSYKRRSSGPYGTLISADYHTHPTYPKPEVKYIDKAQTGVAFTTTPVASPMTAAGFSVTLNTIAAGATVAQRIGQQVAIRSCTYRYQLTLPTIVVNQVPTSGRVMLIWDRQPNTLTALYTDIFVAASYLSYMSPGAAQRFVILRNNQYALSPNGTQTEFQEGHIKINMLTMFGTANNVPNTGSLLLVFISDQATAANQPTIAGNFRVRYMDN